MKNYYRLMLGDGNRHAAECFVSGYVGTDYKIDEDLTGKLPDEWREFNRKYIPIYERAVPSKTKIGAGLAMGALWTVSKGLQQGDILLCPDVTGRYRVGDHRIQRAISMVPSISFYRYQISFKLVKG